MQFDLSEPFELEQFRTRCELLIRQKATVHLTKKEGKRTYNQNNYLHLILGYLAIETGCTLEWVKQKYYKILCNPNIFIREVDDPYMGKMKMLRSSAHLTTEEMTTSIERLRNWASQEAGIYLPSPEEKGHLNTIEKELGKYKNYL